MSEFVSWSIQPDWSDIGRIVEVKSDDGSIISGELICDDTGFDGEEEYPIWAIVSGDGSKHSFADKEWWRFI